MIGVLAAVGIAVGAYQHMKNKKKREQEALKNKESDHGFEDNL